MYGAAARRALGLLLGGEAGEAMGREEDEAMRARGVRAPERYAQWLPPGRWS